MIAASGLAISYPSFAEFLIERFQSQRASVIAAQCGAEEQTVIAWSTGTTPGKQCWERIERALGYQFAERRFAEAAADAGFPPVDAPDDIRGIRTQAALVQYLTAATKLVTHQHLAAFFGWPPTTLGLFAARPRHVFDRVPLAELLRRLPELPRHLRGDVCSMCTPTVIIGAMLREYRQRRGETQHQYAARIGIRQSYLQYLEEVGRGRKDGRSDDPARAASIRDSKIAERILAFLTEERAGVGEAVPVPLPPPPHPAVAPATPVDPEMVITRLAAFVEMAGSQREAGRQLRLPSSTISGILKRRKIHPKIAARIVAAPDAVVPSTSDVIAASERLTPVSRAPRSVEDRLTAVEAELAALRVRDTGTYVSPLSTARFRQRAGAMDDAEITAHRERIRGAAESLGALASIADDATRWQVQNLISPEVDELFLTLEGFLRKYPSASLETLETMRRFAEAHRRHARTERAESSDTPHRDG